jgi:hypothetical protein
MKSQSIAYLLNRSEHIYWILDLEDEVHSIWVIWTSGLQRMQGQLIFRSWMEQAIVFSRDRYFKKKLLWGLRGDVGSQAPALSTSPSKFIGGRLASAQGDLD